MKGEQILITGILADLITTVIGYFYGLEEGNGDFHVILLGNFVLMMFLIWSMDWPRKKWVDYILGVLGIIRFSGAVYNILMICWWGI